MLLFLQGGPSHIEFFDPKMTAPEDVRSITGEVKTKLPGITFGGSFAKLAKLTDQARPFALRLDERRPFGPVRHRRREPTEASMSSSNT